MLKKLAVWMFMLALAGCAASPASKTPNPFAPYALKDPAASSFSERKAYRLGTVNVTLDQMKVNPAFPDQAALKEVFAALLASHLAEKGLLAAAGENALELSVDIQYKRVFMGEAIGLSKGFAGSLFSYASEVRQGGNTVATYQSERMATNGGIVGNLLKIGKQLTMTGSPEDEKMELEAYARAIASNLPR